MQIDKTPPALVQGCVQAAQRNEKVWGPQMGVAGRKVAVTVFLGKSPGSMSTA